MPKFLRIASAVALLFLASTFETTPLNAVEDSGGRPWRRPVSIVLSADQTLLYVANQRSGSLSVVDPHRGQVVDEVSVGQRLANLRRVNQSLLLACDEAAHHLLLLELGDAGRTIRVKQRMPVARFPVEVCVTRDQRRAVVASLWSRQLTFVDLPVSFDQEAVVTGTLDLPFAPRCLKLVKDDTQLIVGDAFGGQLGVVDMSRQEVSHQRELPGHNIRGIEPSANGRMLVVAHQMLNELAHTVRNDVHWGLLMSNDLRWLQLESVLSPDADLYHQAHMHPLGHAGSATGDPSGLAVGSDGTVIVTLGGVDEVAIGREDDFSLRRLPVGRRPTAVAVRDDNRRAYVANTFDDSVSVVDLENHEIVDTINLGPAAELSLADRGELLFFDARLSHDGWMSCHSCHTEGHTNGLMSDNFSDSSFGAPKRVLTLLGVARTEPFAWNASASTLHEQIRKSIEITMQSDEPARDRDVEALAEYLISLSPPPSLDAARNRTDEPAIRRGAEVFEKLQCSGCHIPPRFTSADTYDVGLEDQQGNRSFNPPSLRGLSQRGPYFHDNRAESLRELFVKFRHQLEGPLPEAELEDLLAFLRSL